VGGRKAAIVDATLSVEDFGEAVWGVLNKSAGSSIAFGGASLQSLRETRKRNLLKRLTLRILLLQG
jgi:hypothetical protein